MRNRIQAGLRNCLHKWEAWNRDLWSESLTWQMFTTAAQLLDLTDSKNISYPSGISEAGWIRLMWGFRKAYACITRRSKAHRCLAKLGPVRYALRSLNDQSTLNVDWKPKLKANLVLQDTIERIFVDEVYADIKRGIFLVRGENVLLLGEIVRQTSTSIRCAISELGKSRTSIRMIISLNHIPKSRLKGYMQWWNSRCKIERGHRIWRQKSCKN